MKKFKIPCGWEVYGSIEVEAETLEKAIEKIENSSDPLPHGEYVEDSFYVNHAVLEVLKGGNK